MKDYKRGMTWRSSVEATSNKNSRRALTEGKHRHESFAKTLNNRIRGLSKKEGKGNLVTVKTGQEPKKKRGKIFFGWWTVMATGIMNAWAWGTWGYGFGAYIDPLTKEFGWTRAEVSAGYSLRSLEGGLEGPLGGMITDKYGPRFINLIGILLAGTGLFLMYFITELWQFLLVWGFVVSMGFNLGFIDPLDKAISDWFVKKRGLAQGVARGGLAVGSSALVLFMTILLINYGWRQAFLIASVITFVLCIPLTWFFIKPHRPEYYGLLPDGVTPEAVDKEEKDPEAMVKIGMDYAREETGEIEFTLRQAIRTATFWLLAVSALLRGFVMPVVTVHQIAHVIGMGIDPVTAAEVLGLMLIFSSAGRLAGGIFADKLRGNSLLYLTILAYGIQTLGVYALMEATNITILYLYTILYGIGQGTAISAYFLLRTRYYGRKAFATVAGTMMTLALPATIVAPIYAGWVYDVTGSYRSAFTQTIILGALALVVLFFAKPPKPPKEIKKVTEFL